VVYKEFIEGLREITSVELCDKKTMQFSEINTRKTRKLLIQVNYL
jgi:hypothetical protein